METKYFGLELWNPNSHSTLQTLLHTYQTQKHTTYSKTQLVLRTSELNLNP